MNNGLLAVMPNLCGNPSFFYSMVLKLTPYFKTHYSNKFVYTVIDGEAKFISMAKLPPLYQMLLYNVELELHTTNDVADQSSVSDLTIPARIVLDMNKHAFVTVEDVQYNCLMYKKLDSTYATPLVLSGYRLYTKNSTYSVLSNISMQTGYIEARIPFCQDNMIGLQKNT